VALSEDRRENGNTLTDDGPRRELTAGERTDDRGDIGNAESSNHKFFLPDFGNPKQMRKRLITRSQTNARLLASK